MDVKLNNKVLIYSYIVSFFIVWLVFIFFVKKNDFDLEYREKDNASAVITKVEYDKEVREHYDGRRTEVYDYVYIEYNYSVNGKKYEYGEISCDIAEDFEVGDKINIEYVKTNPSISNIKGLNDYSYNFFVRNLIPVIAISIFVMIGVVFIYDKYRKYRIIKSKEI